MENKKLQIDIYFITCGDIQVPSSRYRAYLIADELKKYNINTFIIPDIKLSNISFAIKLLLRILKNKNDSIVLFQKTQSAFKVFIHIVFRMFNIKTIFDFDDSIFLYGPFFWGKLTTVLQLYICNYVIVGNKYLSTFAKKYNSNITIIPTSLKLNEIKSSKNNFVNKEIKIGWTGTKSNLEYLKLLSNPLEKLSKKYKFIFLIIAPKMDSDFFNFKFKYKLVTWSLKRELEYIGNLDIGVMPLSNDPWTRGKCGFKAIQYMSLEIPSVISSVGLNKDLIKNNINGFLADNEKQWYLYLEKLIKSSELRRKIGLNGRRTVEDNYNIEIRVYDYLRIINNLLS